MEHVQTGSLNNDFRTCLAHLMENGMVAHPRGTTTRELLNYNISLTDARDRVINFPERKTNLKYLLGELVWYFAGSNDPAGILPYSKFWNNIRNSGDMQGYEAGTINSNYGYRLFGHHNESMVPVLKTVMTPGSFTDDGTLISEPKLLTFPHGQSQWLSTIDLLTRDKDSRQAIINIHLPADRHAGNLDVPCTLTLQFFIRENNLHMIVNMRSNDIILGFTNDVFQFTMLQEVMQVQLKSVYPELELGQYFHNAGSMHVYDRHFEMANKIIANDGALNLSMVPMDVFNADILSGLVGVEAAWIAAGASTEFDFTSVAAWSLLTPYWQNLVLMCFGESDDALHAVFGINHD